MVNVTAAYSSKTFSFEDSKLLLDLCLPDNRILYFWYVLKFIYKFIIELHALQCLFVRGSNKKQRRSETISNFTKRRLFHLLWQPSALGVISQCGLPLLYPSKKNFPAPSILPRREYTWALILKESLLIYFEIGCSPFSRVGLRWWTLL